FDEQGYRVAQERRIPQHQGQVLRQRRNGDLSGLYVPRGIHQIVDFTRDALGVHVAHFELAQLEDVLRDVHLAGDTETGLDQHARKLLKIPGSQSAAAVAHGFADLPERPLEDSHEAVDKLAAAGIRSPPFFNSDAERIEHRIERRGDRRDLVGAAYG